MPCTNCGSAKHRECCAQCGAVLRTRRRGRVFCSMECERIQTDQDEISAALEHAYLTRNRSSATNYPRASKPPKSSE